MARVLPPDPSCAQETPLAHPALPELWVQPQDPPHPAAEWGGCDLETPGECWALVSPRGPSGPGGWRKGKRKGVCRGSTKGASLLLALEGGPCPPRGAGTSAGSSAGGWSVPELWAGQRLRGKYRCPAAARGSARRVCGSCPQDLTRL